MITYRILIVLILAISLGSNNLIAQNSYKTSSGQVTFNASTPLEDIKASNKSVNAILKDSGELAVVLLVREFDFRRKLMQEHFNENYLESDIYPKSYFLGTISNVEFGSLDVNPSEITIKGKLNLHGTTKSIAVPGTISKKDDRILLESTFIIRPEDYDVEIPTLMFKKIAREVEVRFSFQLPRQ